MGKLPRRHLVSAEQIQDFVDFFVGKEVEATPAKGRTTLFVVGRHSPRLLRAVFQATTTQWPKNPVTHVCFGSGWSFDGERMFLWEKAIRQFLEEGLWCSLRFKASQIPLIRQTGLCRNARFIPIIQLRAPHALSLGNNAILKLDDRAFDATNPGTWSTPLRLAMRPESFTDWAH